MLFPDDPCFSESEARKHLGSLEDLLRSCVLEAATTILDAGREFPLLGKAYEYLSTRQHVMNSAVVELVKEKFGTGDLEDVQISTDKHFVELRVNGAIDLRFKQIDKSGRTANYPTQTSWLYNNQLPLSGDQKTLDVARLTLGWRWNVTATEIADVEVVYRKGDETQWKYSILENGEIQRGEGGMPIVTPPAPKTPTGRTEYEVPGKTTKKKDQEGA
jgi:hypothetical protein